MEIPFFYHKMELENAGFGCRTRSPSPGPGSSGKGCCTTAGALRAPGCCQLRWHSCHRPRQKHGLSQNGAHQLWGGHQGPRLDRGHEGFCRKGAPSPRGCPRHEGESGWASPNSTARVTGTGPSTVQTERGPDNAPRCPANAPRYPSLLCGG